RLGLCPHYVGKIIQGFLFTSEDLHNHWHTLDEFEGAEYERVPVEVTTSSGETVQSYIYMLKA
ncbi:gamma-glutamylcyclotransferase, partial [Salmonella enterica]|nr:gamma-glutamylcyclotransferase [Salmonella enterica]